MKKLYLMGLFLMACVMLVAQVAPPVDPIDVVDQIKNVGSFSELIGLDGLIMAALITIAGYISPFVPFVKKIPTATFRVLTFAVIIIAGAALFGFAPIWKGLVGYFFSTSLYEVVLQWFKKTDKPEG